MTAAHRIAAILAADVAGYGHLVDEDEAGTANAAPERREAAGPIASGLIMSERPRSEQVMKLSGPPMR
jgi:hypothetical protein